MQVTGEYTLLNLSSGLNIASSIKPLLPIFLFVESIVS